MVTEEQVYEVLRECYDPEIPLNIVDLGLIYGLQIEDGLVGVRMSLTGPGCPMGPELVAEVTDRIEAVPGVQRADVELVFEPPWSPDRMSEDGKLQLGLITGQEY